MSSSSSSESEAELHTIEDVTLANDNAQIKADSSSSIESDKPERDSLPKRKSRGDLKSKKNTMGELIAARSNPINFSFEDIKYEVTVKKKFKKSQKQILNGVTGYVKAGQVLAILGSSGAGKTTFLNVLAGRVQGGNITGTMRVNGFELDAKGRKTLSHLSGYVMQDDVLLSTLTVRETLTFSAMLRIPGNVSSSEKRERVDKVIAQLGLTKSADTIIGDALRRGISGGERKRVNIGVELITDPSMLFLDEPTSGLDSFTAFNIMETLISFAKNEGRTVVCTIHQPRSNIFALFDMLLVLSEGSTVYFGRSNLSVNYFSSIGFECPTYANPADYLLDISAIDGRTPEALEETKKTVSGLIESYSNSNEAKTTLEKIEQLKSKSDGSPLPSKVGYATGPFTQTWYLLGRSMKNFYRGKVVNMIRLFQTAFFAIILGLIYLKIDSDQSSITDRVGALFFILLNQSFGGLFGVLNEFTKEKPVFMRERQSRTYRLLPYYITKSAAELPGQIFFPVLFCLICYWMIGFHDGFGHFIIFAVIIVLASLNAVSIGLFLAAAAPTVEVANVLAPILMIIFVLFGGFYVNTANIPKYFIWIEYLSYLKYSFAALMQNEFDGLHLYCKANQFTDGSDGSQVCPLTKGDQVLTLYGLDGSDTIDIWANILVLLGLMIAWRTLGYIALRIASRKY